MAEIKVQYGGDEAVITFGGSLTVREVKGLKETLVEEIGRYDRLKIDFKDVTEVDLSFLQLLCAAHRHAVKARKELAIVSCCPVEFMKAVEALGFPRHKGCMDEAESGCLWAQGNGQRVPEGGA